MMQALIQCMERGVPLLLTDANAEALPQEVLVLVESRGGGGTGGGGGHDGVLPTTTPARGNVELPPLAPPTAPGSGAAAVPSPAFGSAQFFEFDAPLPGETPQEPLHLRPIVGSVALGGSHGVVEVAAGFVLFVACRQQHPQVPPVLLASARVVNFRPTPAGLQDRLLGLVVGQERAALEEQRLQVEREAVLLQRQSDALADVLLRRLNATQGGWGAGGGVRPARLTLVGSGTWWLTIVALCRCPVCLQVRSWTMLT